MKMNLRFPSVLSLAAVFILAGPFGLYGCNDGQFSGGGAVAKKERNTGKTGKGDEANPNTDDSEDNTDSNDNGIPDRLEDLNNNGIPDGEEGKAGNPNAVIDDGGSSTLELLSDGTITQTRSDRNPTVTIELMDPKDITKVLKTFGPQKPTKAGSKMEKMCLKGKETVFRVSFGGDQTRVLGRRDKCTFTYSSGGTSAEFGVDSNGGDGLFGIGDCKAREDDDFRLTCPEAKTMRVDAT